jgi:cytochrome c oxidase subunit IV
MLKLAIHIIHYAKLYLHLLGIIAYLISTYCLVHYFNVQNNIFSSIFGLFLLYLINEFQYKMFIHQNIEDLKEIIGKK